MTSIMEQETLNKNIPNNFLVEQISTQKLIDLAVDSANDNIGIQLKQELFERGKDNIKSRIEIKKLCKIQIQNIELLLEKTNSETSTAKEIKLSKHQFLNALSVLDRLQIEWQRHDLGFSKH